MFGMAQMLRSSCKIFTQIGTGVRKLFQHIFASPQPPLEICCADACTQRAERNAGNLVDKYSLQFITDKSCTTTTLIALLCHSIAGKRRLPNNRLAGACCLKDFVDSLGIGSILRPSDVIVLCGQQQQLSQGRILTSSMAQAHWWAGFADWWHQGLVDRSGWQTQAAFLNSSERALATPLCLACLGFLCSPFLFGIILPAQIENPTLGELIAAVLYFAAIKEDRFAMPTAWNLLCQLNNFIDSNLPSLVSPTPVTKRKKWQRRDAAWQAQELEKVRAATWMQTFVESEFVSMVGFRKK
jgi:hypothetical protein